MEYRFVSRDGLELLVLVLELLPELGTLSLPLFRSDVGGQEGRGILAVDVGIASNCWFVCRVVVVGGGSWRCCRR